LLSQKLNWQHPEPFVSRCSPRLERRRWHSVPRLPPFATPVRLNLRLVVLAVFLELQRFG
jgi:hypothetical protein